MRIKFMPLAVVASLLTLMPFSADALTVREGFNPNILIQDSRFSDTQTMGGADGVQKFLESKGSILADTSPSFLALLSEPTDPSLKQALGDPGWNIGRQRTAAELIWDAAQASGMNPQVILVTLNKEQSLVVTNSCPETAKLQRMLNHAMGFDCPDSSGCGNLFPGFYYQLFGNLDVEGNRYLGAAKSLMKSFNTPGGRGPNLNGRPAKVGEQVTLGNTIGAYFGIEERQTVTIGNLATAALYRYTPHVFNGNYNFWNFFTSWFKYSNNTLLTSTEDGTTYVIEDGLRKRVPAFVATARGLDLSTAIRVSPAELGDYPQGSTYAPPDGTVISVGGSTFAFMDGIMHPVSSFVLTQRNIDPAKAIIASASDISLYVPGSQLTPSDGTIFRGVTDINVYQVENGVLKKFSEFVFNQREAYKQMQVIPDSEIALYPKSGFVPPLPGTLIKIAGSDAVYVMANGQRHPLTDELFKNLGYNHADAVTLTSVEEMADIPLGAPSTPHEGTYFSIDSSPELFVFKNGTKHPIFSYVAKQRGITPDYRFEAAIVSGWPDGIALPPRDGTLVKSPSSPDVFLVSNGQLRKLTMSLADHLSIQIRNVVTLPDHEIAAFAKNGYAEPSENTYFKVSETNEFFLFRNGAKCRIYPFVATQRGMTPDFTFPADAADGWALGTPIMPREGTFIKSDTQSTVYYVTQGKLCPLSYPAFIRLGGGSKKINTLTQPDIDAYPKGELITK